jgi:hypothetical protein
VRQSLRGLPGTDQGQAKIVQRFGIVWILLNGFSETLDRTVQIAGSRRRLNSTRGVKERARNQIRTGRGGRFSGLRWLG